eukprot:TRINITY_DN2484_c1_g1_i1.p1 TRINITY_DN2484_c1_g1~~TRINITY_DN2484_c1_g1_i1.p1  ORF type:complete len:459 (-),score=89.01 TRINITY_DN2484_c1_g1_i1:255-1517(-)
MTSKQGLLCIVLIVLNSSGYCVLPEISKFEGVFKGEGLNCQNTLAQVTITNDEAIESAQGVVEAVSVAIADAVKAIEDSPTKETVSASAQSASKAVETAVAVAKASIVAKVLSPKAGCWGVAFGKAQAVAIANATAKAVASALAEAVSSEGSQALIEAESESIQTNVTVAVEKIALLLADGSGANEQKTASKEAIATAKATAINCALAQAFAVIDEDINTAEVLAVAGCIPSTVVPDVVRNNFDGCSCVESNGFGGDNLCGKWGDKDNGDYICYVQDSSTCLCAMKSERYDGQYWRYCGKSLQTLQTYLGIEDFDNEISPVEAGNGYCSAWNTLNDIMVDPTPIPTPSPTPSPSAGQTIAQCPRIRCIGASASCCGQSSGSCTPRGLTSIKYSYVGQCAGTGQDVWRREGGSRGLDCACL